MSKPSRILKSAWRRAGKPGSLKDFARAAANGVLTRTGDAARLWLRNKLQADSNRSVL